MAGFAGEQPARDFRPFDSYDIAAVPDNLPKSQRAQFPPGAEPVQIKMIEIFYSAPLDRIRSGDNETRTFYPGAHPQGSRQAFDESCFAAAQRSAQGEDRAGFESARQSRGKARGCKRGNRSKVLYPGFSHGMPLFLQKNASLSTALSVI